MNAPTGLCKQLQCYARASYVFYIVLSSRTGNGGSPCGRPMSAPTGWFMFAHNSNDEHGSPLQYFGIYISFIKLHISYNFPLYIKIQKCYTQLESSDKRVVSTLERRWILCRLRFEPWTLIFYYSHRYTDILSRMAVRIFFSRRLTWTCVIERILAVWVWVLLW